MPFSYKTFSLSTNLPAQRHRHRPAKLCTWDLSHVADDYLRQPSPDHPILVPGAAGGNPVYMKEDLVRGLQYSFFMAADALGQPHGLRFARPKQGTWDQRPELKPACECPP